MLVYAAGAIALCITLIWISPIYNLLLFIMYSQLYSFLAMRWAIPISIFLTALLALRGIVEAPESWPAWVIIATLSVLFGVFFALWINSIIEQSQERQRLIEELESTREELARKERRAGILEERGRLGQGDPRHPRPGFYQHRDPSGGGGRGATPRFGSGATLPRAGQAHGPREPGRGPPPRGGPAARDLEGFVPTTSSGAPGEALVWGDGRTRHGLRYG